LVCLRRNKDSCVEAFSIDRFRDLLGVPPGTYPKARDFRRFVIEPAVLEVNGLSDIQVDVGLQRRHVRAPIDEVVVSWRRPEPDEYREAVKERNRHKAGRMARLREKVETVATPDKVAGVNAEAAKLEKMREREKHAAE
jgi:hypothetical protein